MAKFNSVQEFLDSVPVPEHRAKVQEILDWVSVTWPELELAVKWNQPMFLHHGTFIIAFSVVPKNIAVSPEAELMDRFRSEIEAVGYTTSKRLIRIGWDDPIDHPLLTRLIETQLEEKADTTQFWRS